MVSQLRQVKQIAGEAAHQLAGAVGVIEVEAQLLHMPEQILPDIRLHPDTEGMTVVADDVIEKCPQDIGRRSKGHHQEKGAVQPPGEHIVQGASGHQREGQIHRGDAHGAAHIHGEQLFVLRKIAQENPQRGFLPIILGSHGKTSLSFPTLYRIFFKLQQKFFQKTEKCDILNQTRK